MTEKVSPIRRLPYSIGDDDEIPLDFYYIPAHYQDSLSCVLIPHGTIIDRIEKLAYDISQDYDGETIHFLCVLKGLLTSSLYQSD
jgi:hypoxanthine phosphoribosyltransferase